MLSEAKLAYRLGKVTGSSMPWLMNETSPSARYHHWAIDVGLEPPDPENYQMRAGSHMESLILNERELQTGHPITRRGETVDHPTEPDVCVTLDGYRAQDDAVIEAKFLSPFRTRDEYVGWYYPQVRLQMLCVGARKGILVVAQGTSDPIEITIAASQAYDDEMLARIRDYLVCLRTFTPPCVLPPVIPPEKWRTVDLSVDEPNWGAEMESLLFVHHSTSEIASQHEEVGKLIRALVPDDVGKVLAGPFQLSRNRKGIISITTRRAP